MYVDPPTRLTYDYATPIACDKNPRNIIELHLDSDDQDFYILEPEPIKRKPTLMFTPSQTESTICPNTFTAQDAGIYSNAEFDHLWNRILFSKPSESTLQLLGKALSYSFISSNTPNYDANSPHENPYNTLRIGLHDKLINLTPLFTPTWFSDAFMALFGYPCYILTQCGIYFSTFLFVQGTLTHIVKLNKTISIKHTLNQNITIFSSIAHSFSFIILKAEMVNDLNHTHRKKLELALPTSKSLDNFFDTSNSFSNNQTSSIINPIGITSPSPFYTKRPHKFRLTRLKLFLKRQPLPQPTIKYRTSMLPSSQEQNPTLPNYSTANQHDNLPTQNDNLDAHTSVNDATDSPIKVYSKTNYPFPSPFF